MFKKLIHIPGIIWEYMMYLSGIKKISSNLRKAKDFNGPFSGKISALCTLVKLQRKSYLYGKRDVAARLKFSGYTIFGHDYKTLNYLFNEIFIANEYNFKTSVKEPLIIDCGANIGMSVLYFKKLFPGSRIMAFEPNPKVYKLLEKNIEINKVSNVELLNIALYDKETEIPFFVGAGSGTLLGSINTERGGNIELKVPAQKLSHYLRNIGTVDLIKMDVEGAELNIISDLFETSTINKVKEYIIEYHHNLNDKRSMLSSFLQKFELSGFNYNIKAGFIDVDFYQDIWIHFYRNDNKY